MQLLQIISLNYEYYKGKAIFFFSFQHILLSASKEASRIMAILRKNIIKLTSV